ncbi:MAG: M23 family metallopeptidase [Bacteroidales bacterium]|nr:M23 family metallopeptidase [Bacteroidales bacterium]
MAEQETNGTPKKWYHKLRNRYQLVIRNESTYEEKVSVQLTRLNVLVVVGTLIIILIVFTTFLIAFTPLREYIPGYTDVNLRKDLYEMQLRADSIEKEIRQKDLYIHNIKNIMEGKAIAEKIPEPSENSANYMDIELEHSEADSALRAKFESQGEYSLSTFETTDLYDKTSRISSFNFFTPLKGLITGEFNPEIGHYGVDIVAERNETIKATLDGTVMFSNWTLKTGYSIGIQHKHNIISIYRHNSALLKKEGSFVKAGEPIAIVGESGELTTGPHLHFELWYNGNAVNPKDYMVF